MNAAFYDLSSLQSFVHMRPKTFSEYWDAINNRPNHREHSVPIGRRENPIEIDKYMNLNLLAIANTRYIISEIELVSDAIRYVDGPNQPPPVYVKNRAKTIQEKIDAKIKRYLWFLGRFFKPWKVYIYEIPGALPRVYVPNQIVPVDDAIEWEQLYKIIASNGIKRKIVVRNSQIKNLSGGLYNGRSSLKIKKFKLIRNGYQVKTNSQLGGLIVINASYYPFFTAHAGGKTLSIIPVNAVQMAVKVPPGKQTVSVIYRRPSLTTKIIEGIDTVRKEATSWP